ncbi:MAG: hypothetical protein QNJ13_09960 [Paracoccaceae bacterium]|nr:hypothetical protein [Paracoccaceae bacterium]
MPLDLATLWIGPRLGLVENLSAQSMAATGHRLTIYAYGPLDNVPEPVEVRDAREIFPDDRVVTSKTTVGASLHSNLFRYALLRRTDAVWVDLDVVPLRPLDLDTADIFGLETATKVNGAVLRLAEDSPALAWLSRLTLDTHGIPSWVPFPARAEMWLRSMGRGVPINAWPHGTTGPVGLTHALKRTGEFDKALPVEAFYPLHWSATDRLLKPGAMTLDDLPMASYCLHLWSFHLKRGLKRKYGGEVPAGSLLADLIARYSGYPSGPREPA